MKQQLSKKFSAYLPLGMAFIVTAIMFSASANAQIVYTDVNPDTTISCTTLPCTQSYNLDLNNDGIVDFTLYASMLSANCLNYSTMKVYVSSQSGNGTDTLMMNANDLIDSNLAFSTSYGILRSLTSDGGLVWTTCISSSGSWTSGTDHYLGLQITAGANTYYGWVRLNVVTYAHHFFAGAYFTVKDYAYNSIPNQPILAGQSTATGIIENSFASSINLYPNPATNHVTIALGNNNKKVEVTITNITGKIIYSIPIVIGTSETQKIEVNTQDFAEGIYVVQIQAADFIGTKKLVIEK